MIRESRLKRQRGCMLLAQDERRMPWLRSRIRLQSQEVNTITTLPKSDSNP